MSQRFSRASRRGETGFTLIELLVVIIILGILAAVVVFAVSGVGDKGKSSAVEIDARTLRTAEEAFCAKTGQYGTINELAAAGLLSDKPSYNGITVDSPGPCGSTRYDVFPTDLPEIDGLNGTICAAGNWCDGPRANGTGTAANQGNRTVSVGGSGNAGASPMVLLASGRVLAIKGVTNNTDGATVTGGDTPTVAYSIFDPAASTSGSWTPVAPPDSVGSGTPAGSVPNQTLVQPIDTSPRANNMLLIQGGPEMCGSNCGKVLAHFTTRFTDAPWRLYDENTSEPGGSAGSWTNLSTADPVDGGPYRRLYYNHAVQLTRTPCGAICGKVLIVGQGGETTTPGFAGQGASPTPPVPEIWDPAAGPLGSFRKLQGSGYEEHPVFDEFGLGTPDGTNPVGSGNYWSPTLTLLNNGKVLMLTGLRAQLFDPVTETFSTIAAPPFWSGWGVDRTVHLPDGSVLISTNHEVNDPGTNLEIYHPDASGGTWETTVQNCGDGGTNKYCQLLTSLPGGRVLAKALPTSYDFGASSEILRIFDPSTKTWSPATSPLGGVAWAILLRQMAAGGCDTLCNRTLGTAAAAAPLGASVSLYTP